MKPPSIKTQLIIFLGLFAVYLAVLEKDSAFLSTLSIAAISAVAFESLLTYIKAMKLELPESALISGLIIGFVLSKDNPRWMLVLASLFAIVSKHLIRFNKKHLFNPAAFGIFLTIILFGAQTQWRGTYQWQILLPFGSYFIFRIRKLEILISYGLTALSLFALQALIQKTPVANIFWYLSYFFIFIMLIEPKTTPVKLEGKLIFGIAIALLIFAFTAMGMRFDVEILSLLVLNLLTPALNKASLLKTKCN